MRGGTAIFSEQNKQVFNQKNNNFFRETVDFPTEDRERCLYAQTEQKDVKQKLSEKRENIQINY